jgi:hypothetical protein
MLSTLVSVAHIQVRGFHGYCDLVAIVRVYCCQHQLAPLLVSSVALPQIKATVLVIRYSMFSGLSPMTDASAMKALLLADILRAVLVSTGE